MTNTTRETPSARSATHDTTTGALRNDPRGRSASAGGHRPGHLQARGTAIRSPRYRQAPSRRPAFVGDVVRAGTISVSVEPTAVPATRRALAAAERRVLLERALATRTAP